MKNIRTPLLVACALALFASQVFAQARRIPPTPPGSGGGAAQPSGEVRAASILYDEASTYAGKKFQEFAAKRVPFDPKVMEQTLKEQKELAARYATELYARRNLSAEDLYYMGLLYNVSANEDRTIETFKRYLERDKAEGGDKPQNARYILVQRLAQVGHMEEAESTLADYLRFEPRKQTERVIAENAVTRMYRKAHKLDRAASHAEEAFKAAKTLTPKAQNDSAERLLSISSILLVGIYQDMKKPLESATGVLEEVRNLSTLLPSPRLYVDATIKLADVLLDAKRKPDALKTVEGSITYVRENIKNEKDQRYMLYGLERKRRQLALQGEAAPEITVAKWIEQAPVKMSDLRGRVVLLDFWATWCGPCLASFPQLKEWHEKYRDRGLVILGLTRYYGGRGAGKPLTKDEELTYLERFKKQYDLPYGVAVTDTDNNHDNYGVQAIPTTVLIDRHGVIRFLATGVGGGNEAELTENIEKLLEEK